MSAEEGKVLHLGHGFSLPAEEFIESRVAILGQSGRGKTGLARRVLEECYRVRLPFIVFDPSGTLWGLKSSYDGKQAGLPILVIGGEHGDLPLVRTAGAEVARAVVAANVSCVVDLSQESKATYRTFAREFAETLFAINDTPRLVVLDEAPELVPQSLAGRPDLAATFDAVERLVRQGRNKGIGVLLVSQRAATISKDVLTQCGSLFVFGLVGTPDRKALRDWVGAFGDEEHLRQFEEGLATLERRECWFWSPSEFKRFERLRVLDFHTFHPDRTHLRRLGLLHAKPVTTDVSGIVSKLGARMEALALERADAARVPGLRREVERLTREVTTLRARPPPAPAPVADPKAGERAAAAAVKQRDAEWYEAVRSARNRLLALATEQNEVVAGLLKAPSTGPRAPAPAPLPAPRAAEPAPLPVRALTRENLPLKPGERIVRVNDDGGEEEVKLLAGERRILKEVVLGEDDGKPVDRASLGALVGMASGGGGFRNYIGHVKRLGLVSEEGGRLRPTEEGRAFLGPVDPIPSDPKERAERFLGKLLAGERRMLETLIAQGQDGATRAALAESVGMESAGGGYRNYVGHLKRLGCVNEEDGVLRAAPELWVVP